MRSLMLTLQYFESTRKAEDAEEVLDVARYYLLKNLISTEVYAILELYVKSYIKKPKGKK